MEFNIKCKYQLFRKLQHLKKILKFEMVCSTHIVTTYVFLTGHISTRISINSIQCIVYTSYCHMEWYLLFVSSLGHYWFWHKTHMNYTQLVEIRHWSFSSGTVNNKFVAESICYCFKYSSSYIIIFRKKSEAKTNIYI